MRRAGLSLLGIVLSAGSALAGESPYDWSGLRAGVFAGGHWASFDQTELFSDAFGGSWWFPPGPNPGYDYRDAGGLFGLQLDWNWQEGNLVAGLGVEGGTMGIDTTVADPNAPPIPFPGPGGPVTELDAGLFGSLTGKLGFASGRWLAFARGGVSVLDAKARTVDECARSFCGQLTIDAEGHEALFGLTAGAGVEYAIGEGISVAAEYRAYRFEDLTVSGIASNFERYSQEISPGLIHTGRVSLNFAL